MATRAFTSQVYGNAAIHSSGYSQLRCIALSARWYRHHAQERRQKAVFARRWRRSRLLWRRAEVRSSCAAARSGFAP